MDSSLSAPFVVVVVDVTKILIVLIFLYIFIMCKVKRNNVWNQMRQQTEMKQSLIQAMDTGITIFPDQTDQQEHTPVERLTDKINENLCRLQETMSCGGHCKGIALDFSFENIYLIYWRT